jgi:predicted NUDIX family phosphoesterase
MSKKNHIVALFDESVIRFKQNNGADFTRSFHRTDDVLCSFNSNDVIIAKRSYLEATEKYKQIIPYCLVVHRDTKRILAYRRQPSGGEDRLHGNVSIGFGGHVEFTDVNISCICDSEEINLYDTIISSIERELFEETTLTNNDVFVYEDAIGFGVITDDSIPVNRVHIGFVMIVFVDFDDVTTTEDCNECLGFLTINEIKQFERIESWSQIVLDNLTEDDLVEDDEVTV